MVTSLLNTRNQLRATLKWLLSFRKKDWAFEDYPISIHRQDASNMSHEQRGKVVPYSASIVNWGLLGSGNTKSEAIADLQRNFVSQKSERLAKQEPLPRPGTHVPIRFASAERVNAHRDLADDFISRVLDLPWAFISDESSLWDFADGQNNDALVSKIKDIYGVDVSDLHSGLLCEILNRIAREDKFQRWR